MPEIESNEPKRLGRMALFVERHRRFLAGPFFGVIAATAGILVGLFGSILSGPIWTGFSLLLNEHVLWANFQGWVFAFWVLFLLAVALLLVHKNSADTLRQEAQTKLDAAQARLDTQIQNLNREVAGAQAKLDAAREKLDTQVHSLGEEVAKVPELVRTQPEREFQQFANAIFEKSYVAVEQWQEVPPDAHASAREKAAEICYLLHVLARNLTALLGAFDRGKGNYCANIMIFVGREAVFHPGLTPKFFDPSQSHTSLLGQLLLTKSAQFSQGKGGAEQSPLESFSLAVPLKASVTVKGVDKWTTLPGAPFIFHNKVEYSKFCDTRLIPQWCQDSSDLKASVQSELETYFEESRTTFTGFGSAPIFRPSTLNQKPEDREAVGVLNVHWLNARFLNETKLLDDFLELTSPIRTLLGKVIESISSGPGILEEIVVCRDMSVKDMKASADEIAAARARKRSAPVASA